jgi:Fe-S oxidoreductase/nitrate reductase gamma subunit
MYALAAIALAVCAWGLWRRVRVYRRSRPLNRRDRVLYRTWLALRDTLSQWRVLRVPGPGLLHALLFWGLGVLLVGTILIMVQVDITDPLFRARFLEGDFYLTFSLVLDVAGLAVLLMLGGLLVQRFVIRPKGLETVFDDYLTHALLLAILVTGFFVEGARMAATEIPAEASVASFSPVGNLVGRLFVDLSPTQLELLHECLWWLHLVLGLAFIAVVPFTKLRHVVAAPVSYFAGDLSAKGSIATIDLEDEGVEQYGAASARDLAWKDILDADACSRCKRCQDRCPAWCTDKPLSPMRVVLGIGESAFSDTRGALAHEAPPLAGRIAEDALWACTTCRACQEICPTNVEHVDKIIEMRRNLALMHGAFPGDEVRAAIEHIEVSGNPFGLALAARADWTEGLDVPLAATGPDCDVLYFVGCYASFDQRNQQVARSLVKICAAAGISVGILGKDERCCGDPARKLGNEYLYQVTARENIDAINECGARHIVTTCPHCFTTLARDYRDLGLSTSVEHYSTLVERLLREGRVRVAASPATVTYHDSCYLGRYMGIVSEPRAVLAAVGSELREMEKRGDESFCCGGGGGRILAEERLGTRINVARTEMALATGAPCVVSSCPFCLTMLEDGVKTAGREADLGVKDLAEIVAERLVGGPVGRYA